MTLVEIGEAMGNAGVNARIAAEIGEIRPIEDLSPREVEAEIARFGSVLAKNHVVIRLEEGVPPHLVYSYLCRELKAPDFEVLFGEFVQITACSGYCPGCFQRPWCNLGIEETWPEDEEAGHMVYPREVPQ